MRPVLALWAYAAVRAAVVGFCRLFWRLGVEGTENVPSSGPFILSPVHRSNIDTPLVAAVTRRRLRYMGKAETWKYRWIGAVLTFLGGFPVNRGAGDREAIRKCLEVLTGGEPLVLFPEGRRRSGPVVEETQEGAAYFAVKTGAPIVPVGIGGSERAMPIGAKYIRPVRVHLVIGPPLYPDGGRTLSTRRGAVRELDGRLRAELQRLFDEAQERVGTR